MSDIEEFRELYPNLKLIMDEILGTHGSCTAFTKFLDWKSLKSQLCVK